MIGEQIISPLRGWNLMGAGRPWADAHGCILSPLSGWRLVAICLALFAALMASPTPLASQEDLQLPRNPSELAAKIFELTKANKLDEAVALLRAKAAEPQPAADVPLAMVYLASCVADEQRDEQALELYAEVLQRFPRSTAAAIATCGQGFVLKRQGKHAESVACWERGVAYYSAIAPADFIDPANFYSGAWHALGEHYVTSRQWTKGRRAFLNWRLTALGCGNGVDDYLSTRAYNIFICQTHVGPGTDTARQAWQALGCSSYVGPHDIPPFVLVRLYAEADQLDDLQRLAENIGDATLLGSIPASMGPRRAAAILAGIKLARSRRWSDHIAAFDHLDRTKSMPIEDEVCRHVAAWVLLREQNETASAVARGARDNKGAGGDLLAELLINMTGPKAKESLGRLSRNTTSARRKLINDLTRQRDARSKKSKTNSSATDISQARGTTISRLPILFYEPWPAIERGSLPSSLPADLFAEKEH